MVGTPELLIEWGMVVTAIAILLAGISRLRKKLATEANPGPMTYVNELGGYVVTCIVLLIVGGAMLMDHDPSSGDNLVQDANTQVETSPQPTTVDADANWETHAFAGGTLKVSTPDDWVPAPVPDLSPDDFAMMDRAKNLYVRVGVVPKGGSDVTTTEEVASVLVAGVTTGTQNPTVNGKQTVQLGDFAATRVEIQTTVESYSIGFVVYAVDLNDRWAEIRFWMGADQVDSQRPTITRIAESIQVATPDRFPQETAARQFQLHMAASGLLRQGKLDEAIEKYTSCIEVDRNFGSGYFGRGQAYAAKGEFEEAVADFDRVLKVEPASSRVYNERGLAHARLGMLDRAWSDFTEALSLDREESASAADHAATLCNRSSVHVRLDQPLDAMADLDMAIEVAPEFSESYYLRGSLRHRSDDGAGAVSDLTIAIELRPDDYRPYYSRATILCTSRDDSLRDGAKAVLDATKACELSEFRDASAVATLAAAHAEAGDWQTAKEYAAKAIEAAAETQKPGIRDFVAPIASDKPVRWP